MINSEDINKKVLLLALFKKENDESINDVVVKLNNSRVFTLKEGKKILKELKADEYILDDRLSFFAIEEAKTIENEFKI